MAFACSGGCGDLGPQAFRCGDCKKWSEAEESGCTCVSDADGWDCVVCDVED